MKILITESQIEVLRRVYGISDLVDYVIHHINNDIRNSGPGNKPDNFGVYENWVTQRLSESFRRRYPEINFTRLDFLEIISSVYNDKLKMGFKESKRIR
jgi:hypothetical protein